MATEKDYQNLYDRIAALREQVASRLSSDLISNPQLADAAFTAGLAIRLPQVPEPSVLAAVEEDVRAALLHRPSVRRRTRSVPVHLGDTARVLRWIDVFD